MTAHEDPLGVVFGGLGLGLTLGLALQSLVAFAVRSVQLAQPVAPGPPDFATPAAPECTQRSSGPAASSAAGMP